MFLLSFLPILIFLAGSYLLFKTNFFFIFHPIRTLKFAFYRENRKESFSSLMLALAGTLGVGNIVGVAIGLKSGGAGSIFWLIFSSLFSSVIKYCEVYLSAYHKNPNGMIGVIEKSYGESANFLAKSYATFALALAFFMGCIFQAEAIKDSINAKEEVNNAIIIPMLILFTISICALGKERIKGAVSIIIPIAALIYTVMCISVIAMEFNKLPKLIVYITQQAFKFNSLKGGLLAFIISSGIKEGFARGLLSNEAGAGTSSFSHTSHYETEIQTQLTKKRIDDAKQAGIFGIIEVFFDTLFLCPLTAFTILLTSSLDNFNGTLTEISKIFETHLGKNASVFLIFSVICFAVSTVFCWYYYGKVSFEYIFKRKLKNVYSLCFFITFSVGLIYSVPNVIFITDTLLFFLSLISIGTVIKNKNFI